MVVERLPSFLEWLFSGAFDVSFREDYVVPPTNQVAKEDAMPMAIGNLATRIIAQCYFSSEKSTEICQVTKKTQTVCQKMAQQAKIFLYA